MTLRARLCIAFTAVLLTPMALGAAALAGALPGGVPGLLGGSAGGPSGDDERAAQAVRSAVEARCRHLAAVASGLASTAARAGQPFAVTPESTQGPWAICGVDAATSLGDGVPIGLAARAEIRDRRAEPGQAELTEALVGYAYAVQPLDASFFAELSAAAGRRVGLFVGSGHQESEAGSVEVSGPLPLRIEPAVPVDGGPLGLLLVIAGVGVLVATLFGWWFADAATRPLRQLLTTVERVRTGDLSARSALHGRDETGRLGRRLDELIVDMQETQRLSMTDALTGLGNRRHLTEQLRLELERAGRFSRPLGLLVLDLDHFKAINDRYGHQTGDGVLVELAARLRQSVREVDLVFRYGGEEFVILLPETDISGSLAAAERIGDAVRHSVFPLPGQSAQESTALITVTVSVGVSVFPHHARTGSDLLDVADQALYAAKAAGRDTCVLAAQRPSSLSVVEGGQLMVNPAVHR